MTGQEAERISIDHRLLAGWTRLPAHSSVAYSPAIAGLFSKDPGEVEGLLCDLVIVTRYFLKSETVSELGKSMQENVIKVWLHAMV